MSLENYKQAFGPYSWKEQRGNSDVDILMTYKNADTILQMTISRMMNSFEKILDEKVDLVEEGCLISFAADSVYKDRNLIYESVRIYRN